MQNYSSHLINSLSYNDWNKLIIKELNEAGFKKLGYDKETASYDYNTPYTDEIIVPINSSNKKELCNLRKEETEYLKQIGLLNNERCPYCGEVMDKQAFGYHYKRNDEDLECNICSKCSKRLSCMNTIGIILIILGFGLLLFLGFCYFVKIFNLSPIHLLACYALVHGGNKLRKDEINNNLSLWKKILVYVIEIIVAVIISSILISISIIDNEIAKWVFVIILISLTKVFPPRKFFNSQVENRNDLANNENNIEITLEELLSSEASQSYKTNGSRNNHDMANDEQHLTSCNDIPKENVNKYSSSFINSISWFEWNNIMAKELNEGGFKRSRWDSSKGCYESVQFVTCAENPHSFILGEVSKFEEIEFLKNKKLLNNGRCPKCGNPIIGNPCRFTSGYDNRINYHICQSCAKSHGTIDLDFDNAKPKLPYRANKAKKWVLLFVLSCFVIGGFCLIANIIKKHSSQTINKPTTQTYIFNDAFELKLRNDWDFDKMSCPHFISSKDDDTIKYKADFDNGELIFVPTGHNISNKLSAAIYVEYRKVDTKLIDIAHHYQQHQNTKQLKKYVEKSLKDNVENKGIVKDRVKYNYIKLKDNNGFEYHCDLIGKDNFKTFSYTSYIFWNYNEIITIIVTYNNIDSEKWKKHCASIVNHFNWVNPK